MTDEDRAVRSRPLDPRSERSLADASSSAPGNVARARIDVTVRGRVQGVGFRYFVRERGAELGLSGWVANEPDGSVRAVAEGRRPDLDRFLESLERGPAGALVERVQVAWGA